MANIKPSSGYGSGSETSSVTDFVGGHPDGKILPVAISLVGTLVKVQTKENKWFEGVFRAFSSGFEIALEIAHEVESGREEELPRKSTVRDKLIFKYEDVVKIEGTPDLESVVKASAFATDAEISRVNNGSMEMLKDLQPWEPDIGADEDMPAANNGPYCVGWSVEEMFKANEKHISQSDYDEKLYYTAEVNMDPESEIDQEKIRRAVEIAREIERNPASRRAAELENDDEERDIIEKSSGSSANNSTVTTPTSATAPGATNRYVPPNKRTGGGGGDRGNRGARRGGGTGAPFQPTIRNQGGGESRGLPRGPNRDYEPGGGYGGVTTNFYARPNRFQQQSQQQHHQIVAQTSHERSPTGAGVNDWERPRGQKNQQRPQDVRESYGGGPPIQPQGSSGSQMSRPISMVPNRPNMDNSAPNGNRRNMKMDTADTLRKFSKDFVLVSGDTHGGVPNSTQGNANVNPTTTAASSTLQTSRLPPQSSPTQPQLPPPTTSVPPPPQGHQRRSPDLKNHPNSNFVMGGHQSGPPPPPPHHHQQQHHYNQNQPKASQQISPPSMPPPMIRGEVPPRMLAANEAMYQQHQQSIQHPTPDYSNPPHMHQQQQQQQHMNRPTHPSMMVIPSGQVGNGGQPPKLQQMPGHGPPPQLVQGVVLNQPPPPSQMAQPPPAQTPQQQQQQLQSMQAPQQQHLDHDSSSDSIKKSKLNPDAAEFRPQFVRQGSVSSAPPLVSMVPNPGNYPIQVQSPPQQPANMIGQNSAVVYGNVPAGPPMGNPTLYATANVYQQQQQMPHSSSAVPVQIGGQPLYTIQANQPATLAIIPNNSNYRPRGAAPPQPAVAAATGQPIMAAPYAPTGPYVLYNPNFPQTTQGHPTGAAYPQNPAYVMNTTRMFAPQYILPQAQANNDQQQQQYYTTVSPVVQMGPGSYQAVSVQSSMSGAPTMHQSAPAPQYAQQQNNGNNNHSQTPPTSSQQQQQQSQAATNPSPAGGPPPSYSNAGGNGQQQMNATVIAYPPTAQTPQSPQYPTAPGGAYPVGTQQYLVYPGTNFVAAANQQLYGNQGPVHLHNPAAVHHIYPSPAQQQHFVATQEYFAAVASAQQAASLSQHLSQAAAAGMHPAVLRSSSVPFVPGGPIVSGASGQGAPSISHQNSHA